MNLYKIVCNFPGSFSYIFMKDYEVKTLKNTTIWSINKIYNMYLENRQAEFSFHANFNKYSVLILQCDHHSLKLCHIHSAVVCTEVILAQVSHGIPPVLWVSKCEYLSSQRVGQCGLFAAYSPLNTEREERKGALTLLSITLPLPPPKNDDWLPHYGPALLLQLNSLFVHVLCCTTAQRGAVRSRGDGGRFKRAVFHRTMCGILKK